MTQDQARDFMRKAADDIVLRARLNTAVQRNGMDGYPKVASEEGYNCTLEEIKRVALEMAQEQGHDPATLTDQEDGAIRAVIYGES